MYKIDKTDTSLLVQFRGDFDYSTIKQIIYNELMVPNFCQLNGFWLVGKHRANLRLGDVQNIVEDYCKCCSQCNSCTRKMAIVAEPGLTSAILELIAKGLNRKRALSCRVFESREAAEKWVGI